MFEPSDTPRLFGCAPGVDFPRAVVQGIEQRMAHAAPTDWARITLLVNTTRMARRLRDLFDAGPARLLPRIQMITQLDDLVPGPPLPAPTSPLRRRLELATLIQSLLARQPDLAPDAGPFDLADSLATLMDEMQGEGVTAADIAALDVSDQSGHWLRAQQFIAIAQQYMDEGGGAPDPEARQREQVMRLADHWAKTPKLEPVLIVGSTGSRGATLKLMQAVAQLPNGAVILPGYDTEMPAAVWDVMASDTMAEDHPQFRFLKLCEALSVAPSSVKEWTQLPPASAPRNALVSLALRPAPVTDAWRDEGPQLTNLDAATDSVTLVEADSPRAEAIAIALRLRQAAEDAQSAALITPDRMLTRQVTAALDRWDIVPDDSAGTPLHLSPPGRFLRHVASLFERPLDAEALLTLLKHPLCHSGADRNLHQLNTQRLELRMRKDGLPYPDPDGLMRCAQKATKLVEEIEPWATWVGQVACGQDVADEQPLEIWVTRHRQLAERLSAGAADAGVGELWQKKAGQAALKVMEDLAENAPHGGSMSARDYAALVLTALRNGDDIRDRDAPHPHIMIWGTLEARVQGADLVILAGLNDGTWPEPPAPDPWLNRKMRFDAGLLLPERRIGLSAHDFQQAIAAPEVWLTRSIRSDDAETVPSRWMNRLRNLLQGLAVASQPDYWTAMRNRGEHWLSLARQLDATAPVARANRPSPAPPVAARPRRLTVTEIQTLIRDPYAIYAKHVLRLRALRPLVQTPDALLRGILSHDVMERFVRETLADKTALTSEALMSHARAVLERDVPWPAARALWLARFQRAADWIVDTEIARQARAEPTLFEKEAIGRLTLSPPGMELEGRADRIDVDAAGAVILYDYKTGAPPTKDQQKHFDKQLLIEAAMVAQGGFSALGPRDVRAAQFIGMGSTPRIEDAPLDTEPPQRVIAELTGLLAAYLEPDKGYTSRRALYEDREARDFDQLARFGEWDVTQDPVPEVLT
ncbi:MAG: double-strand break repair protein AddB [Tateyamaria sp.]